MIRRRLAQDVGAFILPTRLASTFTLVATAKPDTGPEELNRALDEHLERLAAEPVSEESLVRARNSLLAQHYHEMQGVAERADLLSQFTTYFDAPERAVLEIERYRDLEAADLQAFARHHLRRHQRVAVTVVPAPAARDAEAAA